MGELGCPQAPRSESVYGRQALTFLGKTTGYADYADQSGKSSRRAATRILRLAE
jgi:hypothetical protein